MYNSRIMQRGKEKHQKSQAADGDFLMWLEGADQ